MKEVKIYELAASNYKISLLISKAENSKGLEQKFYFKEIELELERMKAELQKNSA